MAAYRKLMLVQAGPDNVFRLIAGTESWQSLMPHVRSVQPVCPARWRVVLVWRWLPLAVAVSGSVDPEQRMAEYRLAGWPGVRVVVRWVVDAAPGDTASVRVEANVVKAPPLVRQVAARVVRELCSDSLEMVRLLAESDQIARQGIEQ